MKPALLIVDGHSIIFAWPEFLEMHRNRSAQARDELARRLTLFQDQTGTRVALVFDGTGPKLTEDSNSGGAKIFYAPSGKTADDIVERLVAKYAEIYDVTVATCDRAEAQTAISFGARPIDCDRLRGDLERAEREMADTLKRHRKKL